MFQVFRFPSGACEIRFDFQDRNAQEIPLNERRAFIRLSSSLEVVNAWLAVLGADSRYSAGTVYEYAKTLLYALEWLAQEPMNIPSREAVGHSLLALSRSDLRSLFAWLDIPADRPAERSRLVREGRLPAGYRKNALSPSTHNRHNAAMSNFYDWVLVEYCPPRGMPVELTENPMKDVRRPLTYFQQMKRPDGLLPRFEPREAEASSPLRKPQNDDESGPDVLAPAELQLVFDTIPLVSHGRNAANRNGALIRLLLWGMLRKEELVGARWEAVDGETLRVRGKGSKRRSIPSADPGTWSFLDTYTNELSIHPWHRFHGPLLRQLDHEDRPITHHTVDHLIGALKEYFLARAQQIGRGGDPAEARAFEALAGKLHSHIFRATGATYMAKAGMSLVMLALLLGHSDPSTTLRYYISAKQLALTDEVKRICERIALTPVAAGSPPPRLELPNPLSWYQRQGLIPL